MGVWRGQKRGSGKRVRWMDAADERSHTHWRRRAAAKGGKEAKARPPCSERASGQAGLPKRARARSHRTHHKLLAHVRRALVALPQALVGAQVLVGLVHEGAEVRELCALLVVGLFALPATVPRLAALALGGGGMGAPFRAHHAAVRRAAAAAASMAMAPMAGLHGSGVRRRRHATRRGGLLAREDIRHAPHDALARVPPASRAAEAHAARAAAQRGRRHARMSPRAGAPPARMPAARPSCCPIAAPSPARVVEAAAHAAAHAAALAPLLRHLLGFAMVHPQQIVEGGEVARAVLQLEQLGHRGDAGRTAAAAAATALFRRVAAAPALPAGCRLLFRPTAAAAAVVVIIVTVVACQPGKRLVRRGAGFVRVESRQRSRVPGAGSGRLARGAARGALPLLQRRQRLLLLLGTRGEAAPAAQRRRLRLVRALPRRARRVLRIDLRLHTSRELRGKRVGMESRVSRIEYGEEITGQSVSTCSRVGPSGTARLCRKKSPIVVSCSHRCLRVAVCRARR